MSVLVKTEILELIKAGRLSFTPGLDKWQLQAHSVDLQVGFTFLVPRISQMTVRGREAVRVDHLEVKRGNGRYF